MAHLLIKENNCAKLVWNLSMIIEVVIQTNPDGQADAGMNTWTHIKRLIEWMVFYAAFNSISVISRR